jgi:hypothetical protein
MEDVYRECKEWLIEVAQWEEERQELLPAAWAFLAWILGQWLIVFSSTGEEADAAFQKDFREKFPPPLPTEELASDLEEYLKIVEGMIHKLEDYFPSAKVLEGQERVSWL